MLQAANIDLFNPLVLKAHNSECQNLLFPLPTKSLNVSYSYNGGFLFSTPSALMGIGSTFAIANDKTKRQSNQHLAQPRQEELSLLRCQPRDEVGPLAEHVEEAEHGQHHVEVEGGEEQGEVLHRVVQVSGKFSTLKIPAFIFT